MFSGRLTRCLQFFKFNATSPLCSPIDWGSSSTAVSFKFKYVSFLAVSGHFLRFEQPERFRVSRKIELNLLGRLISLLQPLKSKSTSLSRCWTDEENLTKLLQNWRFNLSRFLAFDRSGIAVRCSQLLRLTYVKFTRFCTIRALITKKISICTF